ncbi:uncharacterized protein LOC125239412 [Leguminivora glycinivorella]|uniref:uncharacterized protein LOC125239412 n=1 Tax=Leguminivora glycinivorella TaxID=1035111 RepID=UPI002010AC58|nr:uncharacterized protein LOC125239412 [Leguminivora glycinivorella]
MASWVMPKISKENKEKKSDYIDNILLKATDYTIDNGIFGQNQYIINGRVFKENIKVSKYKEFELYKVKMDEYADSSGVSIDDDTHLQLTLELVPNGFIINSNVFLTHQQWHTIHLVSEDFHRCAVCEVYCDATNHMGCSQHLEKMQRYKPLHKYDLTITRKINSNYHCGVCNTVFDQSLKNQHYSSKTHEDKLLFAINRVSDIMYDFNIHNNNNNEKKDSYYFNIKHNQIIHEPEIDDEDDEIIENKYYNYDENDWYPLNDDYSDDDEPALNLEFSYAAMAKKPKSDDLPDVLEVDLGNKKVTIKFNSWNMLIRPMANRFYCMACKELDHIRKRAEHCNSEGHLARLNECTVVEEYEKHFVRRVDDKCYHCGHCNNLQLINVMDDHIRSVHNHPTTVSSLLNSPHKKIIHSTPTKKEKTEVANINESNISPEVIKIDPAKVFEGLKAANTNLDDIIICTFGSTLKISKLAFNIICQGENDYYCGICEVNIDKGALRGHLSDARHLTKLVHTPFIHAFNVHLFREIRDALHCGLCNELVQIMPEFIIKHKYLEKHIVSLHRALGYFNNDLSAAKNGTNVNNAIPKPAEIPKMITTNDITSNVNTANGIQKVPVMNKNVPLNNIPLPNIVNKIVPVSKNITITTVNSNKNENTKIEATKNVKNGHIAKDNTKVNTDNKAVNVKNGSNKENLNLNKEADIFKNEEFVTVKNGVKDELPDDLDDSYIEDFDLEEHVYLKLGTSYIKISNTAYNSLVDVGDGSKYCFVCSTAVCELSKHVESRGHMDNMDKFKFVDKYNEDLLRQFYLMYHCSICNVVITRKHLHQHLSWPTHALQTENTKISSKKRKNEIKTGTRQITVTTQKENIYLNEKETDIKIYKNITIDKEKIQVKRQNKIVIFNDNVLKVPFDFWHGLSEIPNGYKCKVCQSDFDENEFGLHVGSEWHKGHLEKIEKQYSPALIRKINDSTLNCVMCNTEVTNRKHIVTEHIQGKKHVKHYDNMLKESSGANSYADCDQDVVML